MTLNPKSELAQTISERKQRTAYSEAKRFLFMEIVIFVLSLVLIFTAIFGICVQHGNDMYPAIKDGDIVLYYRIGKVVNTEAVVYEAEGKTRTGRIVASEGTDISSTGDYQMTFDGNFLPIDRDSGIYTKTYAVEGELLPITIEKGSYFILCDNRDITNDSRSYGPINNKRIKGRIINIIRRRQL